MIDENSKNYNFENPIKDNKYPIVLYPDSLRLMEFDFKLEEPIPPTKPVDSWEIWDVLGILYWGCVLGYFFIVSLNSNLIASAIIGIIFIIVIVLPILTIGEPSYEDEEKYKVQLETYNVRKGKYNDALKQANKPEFRLKYKRNKFLKKLSYFNGQPQISVSTKTGASEDYFYSYLIKWFPNNIYRNYGFKPLAGSKSIVPDFIYQDSENNLHIDIEIDEPYTIKEEKPIHYSITMDEKEDYLRSDSGRDWFLLNQDWIVIRFAEEQVVKYPNECCRELVLLIKSISGRSINSDLMEKYCDLLKVDTWTKVEANRLAKKGYRNDYLKLINNKKILDYSELNNQIVLGVDWQDLLHSNIKSEDDDLPF